MVTAVNSSTLEDSFWLNLVPANTGAAAGSPTLLALEPPKWAPQQTEAVEKILQQLIDGSISPQQADDAIRAATSASAARAGWITKVLPLLKWGGLAVGVAADILLNAEPAGGNAEVRWEHNNRFRQMSSDPAGVGRLLSDLVRLGPNEQIRQGMDALYTGFFNAMSAAKAGDPQALQRAGDILTAMYQLYLGPPDATARSLLAQIVSSYARYTGVPERLLPDNAQAPSSPRSGGQPAAAPATPAFDPNLVGPAVVGPKVEPFSADQLNARLQRFAATFNGVAPAASFTWQQVSSSGRFESLPLDQTDVLSKAQAAAAAYNRSGERLSIPVPVDYWDQASGQHVQGVLTFTGLDPRVVLEQFNNYLVALDRSDSFNVRGNLQSILQGAGLSVAGLRSRAEQLNDADFANGLPRIGGRQASFGDSSRYASSKQTIRSLNEAQVAQGRLDDISFFVPADKGRFLFMEGITRGQAAALLQWAIDGGALRDGTSAQAVIEANGLSGLLGIGSDGKVSATKSPPPQPARDASVVPPVRSTDQPSQPAAVETVEEANLRCQLANIFESVRPKQPDVPIVVGTRINKLTPELLAQLPAEARSFLERVGASSAALAIIFPNNAAQILAKEGPKALMAKTSLWLAGVPDGKPFNPSGSTAAPSLTDPFAHPFQDAAYVMNIKGDGTIDFRLGWGYLNDVRPQNALLGQPVVVSDPKDPDTWGFVNIGVTGRLDRNPAQAILNSFNVQAQPGQSLTTAEVGGVVTAGLLLRVPGSEQLAHGLGSALSGFGRSQSNPDSTSASAWGLGTIGALLQSSTGLYVGAGVVPSRDTATLLLDGFSPNSKILLRGSALGAKGQKVQDFSSDSLPSRQNDIQLTEQPLACPPDQP